MLASPVVLGATTLSLACSSLTRQGELIFKGTGPWLRRGLSLRRRGGPDCESVLEETALSWVTRWLLCAGGGDAEVASRPSIDSGVLKEQMGEV